MTTTPDDVLAALELIAARVPDRHVTPDRPMAAAWLVDVGRFDRDVLFAAAREWGEMRFPSVGQFFDACQAAARVRASQRHTAAAAALEGPCPHGCDAGWIEVDALGHGAYRPCELHRPVEFAVWQHRTDPNHPDRCVDCAAVRKGTAKDRPPWLAEAYVREAAVAEPTF